LVGLHLNIPNDILANFEKQIETTREENRYNPFEGNVDILNYERRDSNLVITY
jgi:hypothetical protein